MVWAPASSSSLVHCLVAIDLSYPHLLSRLLPGLVPLGGFSVWLVVAL